MTSLWFWRNANHDLLGSPRRRMRRRYRATVRSETTNPSFNSSPWIFGAPQSGFSCAKRWIRPRISSLIFGLPPRGRDRQRQKRRKQARCQPTTVSGFTRTRTSGQRDQHWRSVVQKSRSQEFSFWPRPFPFQHGDLLAEGKDFEGGIASTAKEDSDGDKEREDDFEHEAPFLTRRKAASPDRHCEIASC